jgi:hypothetical protein
MHQNEAGGNLTYAYKGEPEQNLLIYSDDQYDRHVTDV